MRSYRYLIVISLVIPVLLLAQDDSPSVAEAAKKSHVSKPKSKIVIDDENFHSNRSPIPDMNIEGVDNSDVIIKAIDQYRHSHTPAETESTIHSWYDNYDTMFQRAFDENAEIKMRYQDRMADPQRYPDDYRKAIEQRSTEIRSQIQDERTIQKNGLLMARIQQCIQKIRNALQSSGLKYEWMKIRFGNGNGSW